MLIRHDRDRTIVITQPAHAALSAQLARAWGNAAFGDVVPLDDVYLGALLHDIGWIDWEQTPTLNQSTGLPHSFMQLPTRVHLDIWDTASRRALAFGRYPALLTSMHFTGLYERFHDYSRDSEEDARDARALVAREQLFQNELIGLLRSDPLMADVAADDILDRNRSLVAVWDGISLAICHGIDTARAISGVPSASGRVELILTSKEDDVIVDPWPFKNDRVVVTVDGRLLNDTYSDQMMMQTALEHAPWVSLSTVLVPR